MTFSAQEATPRGSAGARLGDIVHEAPGTVIVHGEADLRILGAHQDSRRIGPGDLFIARRGERANGEEYIESAIRQGAVAVLVQKGSTAVFEGAARIEAEDILRATAFVSASVYGHPTFSVEAVGITGTNGKTTTSYLTAAALRGAGARPGVVGTLGFKFEDMTLPSAHTSPEADELARIASKMRDLGATHLVMEVSSIALCAARADAVRFRVAAFTNLTQDHLDYHGTMEAYGAAKARLFFDLAPGAAAINMDDPFGVELARRFAADESSQSSVLARYSAKTDAPDEIEIAPEELSLDASGISMRVRTPSGIVFVRSPLIGVHNASNLLCALAICHLLEVDLSAAARALSANVIVPGRLERCDDPSNDDVVALVDYAHTPDALERVLCSVRPFANHGGKASRIICVFGCGGDRDPRKRPMMGAIAARLADIAIVTNDNPRSEDPQTIIDAILEGFADASREPIVQAERRAGIEGGTDLAEPGDVVLIAGKGHEPYQILGSETVHFDDREEARRALEMRRQKVSPGHKSGAGREAERAAGSMSEYAPQKDQ